MSPIRLIIILPLLLVANFFIWQSALAPKLLEMRVLTVGKGQVTLVIRPNAQTILIDTGPDASILRALGQSLPEWQRRIDEIILTSPSASVSGGLPFVQANYEVRNVARLPTTTVRGKEVRENIRITYGVTSFLISASSTPGIYYSDGTHLH